MGLAVYVSLFTLLARRTGNKPGPKQLLLAFTRFVNLRRAVDTFYWDNVSTFRAASDKLPKLLGCSEFVNSLRKLNLNWVNIPPYAPSQGGSRESMVKLIKTALGRVME